MLFFILVRISKVHFSSELYLKLQKQNKTAAFHSKMWFRSFSRNSWTHQCADVRIWRTFKNSWECPDREGVVGLLRTDFVYYKLDVHECLRRLQTSGRWNCSVRHRRDFLSVYKLLVYHLQLNIRTVEANLRYFWFPVLTL